MCLNISGPIVLPGEVWYRPLFPKGQLAVLLFNPDETTSQSIGVTWESLGFSASDVASVRDVWAHVDLGLFTGSFTPQSFIPPHGSVMLVLKF